VKTRTALITLALAAFVGLLAYGLLSKGGSSLAIGQTAPDKELQHLNGPDEGDIADYRGHWVLLNFWASWCEPCKAEAPELERFYRRHGREGFVILGINLDDAADDARAFVDRYGLSYPQLRDGDGSERRDAYGMTGFPESFLVDPAGDVALIRRGPVDAAYLDGAVLPRISTPSAQ
jgi:cytochrome c biogenesis protein CcmG/thiol:disulfide interchange protein DsbE